MSMCENLPDERGSKNGKLTKEAVSPQRIEV